MWVTQRVLQHRCERQNLYRGGGYVPLQATGAHVRNVLAYARVHASEMSITVVPRFAYTLMDGDLRAPLGSAWGDTLLQVPPKAANTSIVNVLTGEKLRINSDRQIPCADIFRHFPVALLSLEQNLAQA